MFWYKYWQEKDARDVWCLSPLQTKHKENSKQGLCFQALWNSSHSLACAVLLEDASCTYNSHIWLTSIIYSVDLNCLVGTHSQYPCGFLCIQFDQPECATLGVTSRDLQTVRDGMGLLSCNAVCYSSNKMSLSKLYKFSILGTERYLYSLMSINEGKNGSSSYSLMPSIT